MKIIYTASGGVQAHAESIADVQMLLSMGKNNGEMLDKKEPSYPLKRNGGWKNRSCNVDGCNFVTHSGIRGITMHRIQFHEHRGRWWKNQEPKVETK